MPSWIEQPIFFLDFEGSLDSGVLEYGLVELLGGQVAATKTRCCAATGRVRAEDTARHGLREAEVAVLPPLSADWEEFAARRERGPFAAHYAGAENSLIKSVWPYPRPSPDFARLGRRIVDWGPWIDSARITAQMHPEIGSGRLETQIAALGLQGELDRVAEGHCPPARRRYHAALYDALAGALLLGRFARDPRCAELSIGGLLTLSTLDPKRRDAMTQESFW